MHPHDLWIGLRSIVSHQGQDGDRGLWDFEIVISRTFVFSPDRSRSCYCSCFSCDDDDDDDDCPLHLISPLYVHNANANVPTIDQVSELVNDGDWQL